MTTEIMRRSPITGHGRRAREMERANVANRLSNHAAVAAALFSAVSRASNLDLTKLEPLTRRTRTFAAWIDELQIDRDLVRTYRELVPLDVWRSGIDDVRIEGDLAAELRGILDSINAGDVDATELTVQSKRFDELAESFRRIGRQLIESSTERPDFD